MPRLSANLSWLFTEVPFLERFGEAARAGFRAVEFAFAYDVPERAIADRLAEHGLECVLINAPPGDYALGERGIAALPGREKDFAASFATALRYAAVLRCPRIHVMAGLVRAAELRAQTRATFISNLRYACEAAHAQGVTVLIEALNPRDVPNYLFSTASEAHAIREAVGAPNIKAQMDFYHTQIVGSGARFPPSFDPSNVQTQSWGALTFTFSDCNHGHVDWSSSIPEYVSGGMDLTRLTQPAGVACSGGAMVRPASGSASQ